ncbi:glycosyltransferase [Halocatena salina]|uniref:Glycosyltransferase n=1 Tax=Halocatena salina TaxID=2934340 RepID=A0A8U0A3N7_9EURY|nr:glycosyltransferase [Halocatena salina]UPM42577.1 glycosyltransferase [Halocatena salina]
MPRIALLHAQRDFATALAATAERLDPAYEIDVLSQPQSIPSRVGRVLTGRYDLLQADETVRNGLLGLLTKRVYGTPLVVCIRGWDDYTNAHGHHSWIGHQSIEHRTRLVVGHADCTLFVSRTCREAMRRYYAIGPNRVVDRPFDVARFQDATATDDPGTTILTVTNFRYPQKARGITTILEGLRAVFEATEDLRYVVAGDGQEFDTVADFVASYPHRDRVELLGHRDDVPQLLGGADLFVYVSYLDAFPMAVLEAQAAGLPVVCGATGGPAEAVGTAGRLCPPTPDGIEDAVSELLSDPCPDRSTDSSERMAEYNERAAHQYLDAWDDVLNR